MVPPDPVRPVPGRGDRNAGGRQRTCQPLSGVMIDPAPKEE
jgi:hypothetical protein